MRFCRKTTPRQRKRKEHFSKKAKRRKKTKKILKLPQADRLKRQKAGVED